MSNWERKLSYLHHEIVKFGKYIDALHAAQLQKEKIYAGRDPISAKDGSKQEPESSVSMDDIAA